MSRGVWIGLLFVVALLAGAAPFYTVLRLFPCGNDAMRWIALTDPSRPDWASWVLFDNHFVAYRPVTALLFTVNHLFVGRTPWGWRAMDIALHSATGVLVGVAWAALTSALGSRRRSWGLGVLAAALFLASPVGESVVPFVARRSYSLATGLGLAGLALWALAERPGAARATLLRWGGAGVLLAAVLANETAYVLVPVLGLVTLARSGGPGGPVALGRALAPLVAATAVGVALRVAVLGQLGGYRQRLTARVEDGVRTLEQGSSPLEVFGLAWSAAALPDDPSGDPPFLLAAGGGLVGAALAAWAVGWSLRVARAGTSRAEVLPLLLLVWALGYALLASLSGTWFVRMAYPMAVPVAMWLAWAAGETADVVQRRSVGAWHVVPLALVLAARLQVATPVRGIDRAPIREQFRSSRYIRSTARDLAAIEAPAVVWAAVPLDIGRVGSTVRWVRSRAPEGVEFRPLAMVDPQVWPRGRMLELRGDHLHPAAGGVRWEPNVPLGPRDPLPVGMLVRDQRATWLLDDAQLVPLGRREP